MLYMEDWQKNIPHIKCEMLFSLVKDIGENRYLFLKIRTEYYTRFQKKIYLLNCQKSNRICRLERENHLWLESNRGLKKGWKPIPCRDGPVHRGTTLHI